MEINHFLIKTFVLVNISNLKTSDSFSDTNIPQLSSTSSLNDMILAGESSEIQSLKTKINQLESQIEYNLQGLF